MTRPPELELLQGTLDVLLLHVLSFGPRHGYGVARWIRTITDDSLQIEDGALYTALHRMRKRGWLMARAGRSETGRRVKFYELTEEGVRQLGKRRQTWTAYAAAVAKVLDGSPGV